MLNRKNLEIILENLNARKYNTNMIYEILQTELKNAPESRYSIAKKTGVSEASLCKILHRQQKSIKLEHIEKLLSYFNYSIVKDGE